MKYEILSYLSSELDMNYNENSNLVFGIYNNYSLTIELDEDLLCLLKMPIKLTDKFNINTLNSLLIYIKEKCSCVVNSEYDNSSLKILFSPHNNLNDYNLILNTIKTLVSEFSNNSIGSCCSSCGECVYSSLNSINGNNEYLCFDCRQDIIKNKNETDEHILVNDHQYLFTPIIGSLLASLIGIMITIPLYLIHYGAATIGSVVIGFFALKGYTSFGGELKLRGKVISFIVTLISISIAFFIGQAVNILVFTNIDGYSLNGIMQATFQLYKEDSVYRNTDLIHLVIVLAVSMLVLLPIFKSTTSRVSFNRPDLAKKLT